VVAVDDDVPQLRHVEGFDPGTSHGKPNHSVKMEDPATSESRDQVFGYAEKVKTVAATASSAGVSLLNGVQCTPAESLLEAVQAQHKVFLEPCVIKAFRLAEDAHKGQVKDGCFVCVSVDYALIPSSPVALQFLSSLLSILSVPLCTSFIIIEDLSQLTALSCLSHNNGMNLCDIVFGGFLCMQFRRNGDPYLIHCVETAVILAATGAGSEVVAAGLLHDAVDDSNLSQQFLRYALGDDIADLVTGVSKYFLLKHLSPLSLAITWSTFLKIK
jgi:hypothetical protein